MHFFYVNGKIFTIWGLFFCQEQVWHEVWYTSSQGWARLSSGIFTRLCKPVLHGTFSKGRENTCFAAS